MPNWKREASGGKCGDSGGENAGFRGGGGERQRVEVTVAVETKREDNRSMEGKGGGTVIRWWRQWPVAAAGWLRVGST